MKNWRNISIVSAYQPLITDLPQQLQGGTGELGPYINNVITLVIGLAGILAVVMIIIGGVQYVSTDAWSDKDDGKKKIMAALGGLLLALSSYLILRTIDPTLTTINFKIGGEQVEFLNDKLVRTGGQIAVYNQDTGQYDYLQGPTQSGEPLGTVKPSGNGYNPAYSGIIDESGPNTPIGIKNKNLGNIKKPGASDWEGTVGYDGYGHAIFDSYESGMRAYMLNLKNQYTSGKFKSTNQLISYYTSVEKDRIEYTTFIQRKTRFDPSQDLGLVKNGVVDKAVLYPLARAMFEFENGKVINVSDAQLDAAYNRAFK